MHGAGLWGRGSQSDQAPVLTELTPSGRGEARLQGQGKATGPGQPFTGQGGVSGRVPTTLACHCSSVMVTTMFVDEVLLLYPSCAMVHCLDEEPGF